MIAASKEKINRDRSQTAKSEREPHRVCPSKLTKKELEDVYFALMDTNIELKRTVNTQQDNIKMLNTKVHRLMTAQRSCMKENQCCPQTKAVVNEQRDIIAELKKANDRMSERIRILNMRLCSAKQFLRHTPSLGNSRCTKCCLAPPASLKNSSVTVLQTKKSEIERKPVESSSKDADKDPVSTRTVETETDEQEEESPDTICKENKCRTLMEELKQKITDLQEESSKYHSEYSNRISRLESEMTALQEENARVKLERAATLQSLELKAQREMQLAAKLRASDALCNDISSQLLMEKNKVAELETRVKAAELSNNVARALEKRQSVSNAHAQDRQAKSGVIVTKEMQNQQSTSTICLPVMDDTKLQPCPVSPSVECNETLKIQEKRSETTNQVQEKESEQQDTPRLAPRKSCTDSTHCVTNSSSYVILSNGATPSPAKSKHSDDSGYIDNHTSEEERALAKINAELVKKITDLEEKLDLLRIASAGLKAEQSSKATETKTSTLDLKVDDVAKHEKVVTKDSKNSSDSRDTAKSQENERKKDIPDQASKETECTESPAIHRANQLWAQYPGNDLQQKEDRIQFSNLYRQNGSVDKIVTQTDDVPEKDSMTSRSSRKKRFERKKSLDEKIMSISGKNELVDKMEVREENDLDKYFVPGYDEFKQSKQDLNVQDSYRHATVQPTDDLKQDFNTQSGIRIQESYSFRQGINKPKDDLKQDLNTQTDVKTGIKIQDNDSLKQDMKPKDDLKQDLNTQTDLKAGVTIQDNDVYRPGTDKRVYDKRRKRDSTIDQAIRDKIKEVNDNEENDKQQTTQTRNTSEDDAASGSLDSTSELCEKSVRICSCPRASRRAISVFRSCSGTLRFRTTEVDDSIRQCRNCNLDDSASNANGSDPIRAKPDQGRSVNDARAQTESPDNTDYEISHLSDLPPEHDVSGKSPRNVMSPGEQKTTTTFTDTCTEPSSELPTMSEGELLVSSVSRRRSIGETKDEAVETKDFREAASVSQKMEQALQSIGEELARCRELLQTTRAPEVMNQTVPETRETSTTCSSRVALKHSAATPQLVQPSAAPAKCTFTLHIGTLVLSDEAVIYSRDKSLLLTWKFFDQNVAMTRMRSGRVILFDFTTEYDADLDERFTDYLKYEEMLIVICELNKQNCPFATCALPLHDLLLNPNHRIDMSLTLNVGPDMRRADAPRSIESLVTSDEVGVLDLWCMLRKRSSTDQRRPVPPLSHDDNNELMDNQSDENTSSQEQFRMSEEQYSHTSPSTAVTHPPHSILGRASKSHGRPSQLLDDSSLAKYSVNDKRLSSVIPHEVPTNIRSSGEMRKALDAKRTAQSNDFRSTKGLEKLEDDVLSRQPHQSVSSWARFLNRQSRCQIKARKSAQPSEVYETLRNTSKLATKLPQVPSEIEEPEMDQGDDKGSQQKKAVTIRPRFSQLGWEQPQQEAEKSPEVSKESIVITILWLALNEECGAMTDSSVQRLYVAFSLLGRSGADFETPVSLPKPRSYVEKCVFNFRKSIQLRQCDLPQLGHMGRCNNSDVHRHNPKDCIVFTVISEPTEDPLGLASCEDIGYAHLYLGDVLAVSDGETYVEVVPIHSARTEDVVCGVLCVQLDGLDLVRKAKLANLAQ